MSIRLTVVSPINIVLLFLLTVTLASSTMAATFTVNKTVDSNDGQCDSDCSLREAIVAANGSPGDDTIQFDSQVFRLNQRIKLSDQGLRIEQNGSLQILGPSSSSLTIVGAPGFGVLSVSTLAPVTISDLTFVNGQGAGIFNAGILVLNRVVVKNNFSVSLDGGGIYTQGNLTLNDCEITGNWGSGIHRAGGTTEINRSLISDNSGGGYTHSGTAFLTVNSSTISNNRGRGISIFGGNVTINNSTITGNYGAISGSGIYSFNATISLNNSTVAFNRSYGTNEGGIDIEPGSNNFNIRNSIIAKNTGGSVPSDISGTIISQGYNLIGTTAFAIVTGNTTGNIVNVDPKLLPLANTGGATATHSLAVDSPAIDAGDPANVSSSDQRGIARPLDGNNDGIGRPDIGAVESGLLVTNTNDSGPGSLRQAVSTASLSAANEEIRFSTLFDAPKTILLSSGELTVAGGGQLLISGPGRDKLTISANNQGRIFSFGPTADVTVAQLSLKGGNVGLAGGGAILNANNSSLKLSNVNVHGNVARDGGGLFNSGSMVIEDSVIESNNSNGGGGAISNSGGTLTIRRSVLLSNQAEDGGAIYNSGALAVFSSAIGENAANAQGGGVRQGSGSTTMEASLINGNVAAAGGGLYISGGSSEISNTTVSTNSGLQVGGGGIYAIGGTVRFGNVTITGNTGLTGGGVFKGASGEITAQNTIIARNLANNGHDFVGTLSSAGHNLIGSTPGITITGDTSGNLLNVDPLLTALSDNGGVTFTHRLITGSPAIDAGSPTLVSTTDQRGYSRGTDGDGDGIARSDIGAFETATSVGNLNDSGPGSLRQAMVDARILGGIAEINLSDSFVTPQTILLTSGEIQINSSDSLVINGGGNLTVSGNNLDRIFQVAPFAKLTLKGIKLIDGRVLNRDGGAIQNFGVLTLDNSSISACTTNGGGSTPRGGGAIYNNGGKLLVLKSSIKTNVLTGGDGAGILNGNDGIVEIVNSVIDGNSGALAGGGISNDTGTLTITDSSVVSNNTANRGGGILNNGTATIVSSTVGNNLGQQYGGIQNTGVLELKGSTVSGNRATGDAGGIFNLGTLAISNSTINDNSGIRGGGITNNGGINNDRGFLYIWNSTISSNTATQSSGGGLHTTLGSVRLTNVTIAFNSAFTGGGGVVNSNGIVRSRNSLIARNVQGSGSTQVDFSGVLTSDGYNLIGNTTALTIAGDSTGNLLNIDPLLDRALRVNGGSSKTHAIRNESPAIDAGSAVSDIFSDQRSLSRPFDFSSIPNAVNGNGSDIGSFERQANDPQVVEFATVSGRVFTPTGTAIRNCVVSIVDSQGVRRTSTTSSFGVYSFENVRMGETYTFTVSSKRYRFTPRILSIETDLSALDFTGLE